MTIEKRYDEGNFIKNKKKKKHTHAHDLKILSALLINSSFFSFIL